MLINPLAPMMAERCCATFPLVLVSCATQFIRMSSLAGQSSAGTMRLAIQTGEALTLT